MTANASCCPKCGGTSGHEHEMTETHLMCGYWGEDAESRDTYGSRRSMVRCIDCGARFQYQALARKGFTDRPFGGSRYE